MKTLLALLAFTFTAQAQLVMEMIGGLPLSVGPGTAAYEFTTTAPITLRSLGIWDSDLETPGLYNAHQVGLWDATTHALLATATVPASGATSIGEFWYVALAAPVTLLSGHSYVLGATFLDSDFDMAKGNVTAVVTDSRITMGDALLSTSSGFDFPDLNVSGANRGFYGANGLETAVPEPATVGIVAGLALLGFAALRRRFAAVAVLAFASISVLAEPPVTIRAILDAPPAQRQRLFIKFTKQRPVAYSTVTPAVNRPPVTPGNEHGNRPVVPPGIKNYATP